MGILGEPIAIDRLKVMAENSFGDMVKAVVDVDRELLAIDAELHSDLEALLLENGSLQRNLWGINLYPDLPGADFLEYDSLINIRPSQGNVSRSVDDGVLRQKIATIVSKWIRQ